MGERLYRIGVFGGVALPETQPFDTGYAEPERLAEVVQLPRRHRLFGFARAVEAVEAPPAPTRFRTEVVFRRWWPGERPATVEAEPETEPSWRTEFVFSRADVVSETQEEPAAVDEPETVTPEPSAEPEPQHDVADLNVERVAAERTRRFGRPKPPQAPKAKRGRRGGGSAKGQRLVGLKVGASQLAAAVVVNDGAPEVTQLARTSFEPGVVVDGEVRDEDALAAALKDFFAQAKLPTRGVRIGLASNRIGVRTLDIVGVDDHERFDNAVRFKAHEVLPIAMNESVLDYRVLGERVDEHGEPVRRVLLVVAPRDQVDPYVGAARKAGIKLQGIDLEAFALLRAFVEPQPAGASEAAIVVVAIGHESTTLVVSGAGVCEFTRVFGWGGAQLDAAVAAACSVDPLEAAAIKAQLSLAGGTPAGLDAGLAGKALEAVRTELTLFARELVSSLQFYQKQPDSLGIGEIVVTGGTSQLGGLADSLHTLVGVPVRAGDPLGRVVAGRGVASDPTLEHTLGSLSVAIGLGIEDDAVRSVNLLPSDAQTSAHRRPSRKQILVPAALLVPVAAVGALLLPAKSSVGERESQLRTAEAELATLPQPQGPGIDQSIKGEQARRAAVVADVLSKRLAWDRVLRDLSLVLPGDVWLTDLTAAVPQPLSVAPVATTASAAAAKPTTVPGMAPSNGLKLTGRTYTQAGVAKLLARLATVPTLGGVQLTRSTVVEAGKRSVVEFEIAANVRGAGEAS